jgi:signal transduction histidine kinase
VRKHQNTIRFYHSLYFKLAGIFLSGILVVAALQLWLSISGFRAFVSEINQSLEWNIASSIANEIQPRLLQPLTSDEFLDQIYPYSIANPKLEFYLLTSEGDVFAYHTPSYSSTSRKVDLGPIQEALKVRLPRLPLYGQDPGSARENERFYKFGVSGSVFSVAPVRFNGRDGFLYIIIEGEPFSSRIRLIGQFFLSRLFTWGWFATCLATIALAYFLYRALTRRFEAITNVVQQYESGDYTNTLHVTSNDEIGVLSSALNNMAQKLIHAKSEIEERDKKRRELIALITHDIRSPLAATQGYLDLALQNTDNGTNPTLVRDVQLAANSARFQGYLVEGLFELSKLEAREREPNIDVVAFDELCRKIVDGFQFAAAPRGIKLQFEVQGSPAFVLGDEALLNRVLDNLIGNALRFSPENGVVRVSLEYGEVLVRVTVSDSGQGIEDGQLDRVIEIFQQANAEPNDVHSGAGLGLAIVQRILELHSAKLEILSSPGSGSSFSFNLHLEND